MLDIIRAVGLFAVTNVDDIVLLALFFARGVPPWRVVLGQYLGFAAILAVAIAAALGATLLPPEQRFLGIGAVAQRIGFPVWQQLGDRRRGGFDLRGDGWTVSRCGVPRRHGRIAPPRPRPVLRPGIDFSLSFAFGLKAGLPEYRPAP